MDEDKDAAIFRAAVEKWGGPAQIDMMIEEMAELTKALLKERRAGYGQGDRLARVADVIEELADVELMLGQMKWRYGALLVQGARDRKLARLKERLAI